MALAIYFAPTSGMTAQKYDECVAALNKAGQAHPTGRLYHSAFGTADSIQVFDVWTSQEAFDAFGQTLMPILAQLGVEGGQPAVMGLHNVVMPPAPKPKAAAKKPAPARKKAAPAKKVAPAKKTAPAKKAAAKKVSKKKPKGKKK
jgi:hypothetical protein